MQRCTAHAKLVLRRQRKNDFKETAASLYNTQRCLISTDRCTNETSTIQNTERYSSRAMAVGNGVKKRHDICSKLLSGTPAVQNRKGNNRSMAQAMEHTRNQVQ